MKKHIELYLEEHDMTWHLIDDLLRVQLREYRNLRPAYFQEAAREFTEQTEFSVNDEIRVFYD